MRIRFTVGDTRLDATLLDNKSTKDLFERLPLTATFEDFAGREKISVLASPLTTTDCPPGTDARRGDIAYYSPWGNLAVFYHDAPYAEGLIKLGRIDTGRDELNRLDKEAEVRVEAID